MERGDRTASNEKKKKKLPWTHVYLRHSQWVKIQSLEALLIGPPDKSIYWIIKIS